MTEINSSPDLYALLIGVNYYLPNRLSDGSQYGSLDGAVKDIEDVEKFLLRQPQKPKQIFKLTATSDGQGTFLDPPKPLESPEKLATYENIVKSFDEITKIAKQDDLIYIHYSGHGGRAETTKPEIKSNGIDEALVPTDIGTGEGRYLRDWELAILLKRMVDKGLIVTVILDSCHSGGSTRGGDAKIRGLNHDLIDRTPRLTPSLVNPSVEELNAIAPSWKSLQYATRGGTPVATMIPEAQGYVLLAACRPSEYAYEYSFDGSQSNGALTYWLLDTLNQPFSRITYKMIHDRLKGKINTQFSTQNPMILGEGDRTFLGNSYNTTPLAVNVKEVKLEENKVKLEAGQAQGLRKGAEFAIYPAGTVDFKVKSQRIALARITQREATESWAEITAVINEQIAIAEGSQAVLTSVPVKLLKKVRLLKDQDTPLGREQALQAIETAIHNNGWLKLVTEDANRPEVADYQIDVKAVNQEEATTYKLNVGDIIYEICDRTGVPIILRPAIAVKDANAPAKIVKRLVHLAKYQATEELDNHDSNSELKGKIEIEILGKQDDYEPGDPPEPEAFEDPDNLSVNVGEYLFIKIRNNYSEVLNFTILDLESNWAISQIEPYSASSEYTPLDPGEDKLITLRMSLPQGDQEGTDIFKVFATKDATNFRWLALPSLDQPFLSQVGRAITRSALNPLEELLSSLASEHPTRTGNPVAFASNDWTTEQVTINVQTNNLIPKQFFDLATIEEVVDEDEITGAVRGTRTVRTFYGQGSTQIEQQPTNAILLRYPYLDCPQSSVLNQRFSLYVQILIKSPTPQMKPLEIEDKGIFDQLPELEIVVRARGFDVEGTSTRVIEIKRDDDTEERFMLIPRQLGEQQIRVDFYQNGKRIGTARQNIIIYAEENYRTRRTFQPQEQITLELKNQLEIPPPDLELCVELDRHDNRTLYFTLHSSKSAIDYHHTKVGQVTLESSPEEKIKSVYQELGHLAQSLSRQAIPIDLDSTQSNSQDEQRRAEERFISVGNQLWDELIPDKLKQEYWKFKSNIKSLLITSDEPWIPWEMIKPYNLDQELEDPFWCEQFALSRWLSGPGTADEFPAELVVTVAPDSSNLPNVKKEVDFLQQLNSLNAHISSLPSISNGLELKDYIKNNPFSILHFACHGMFDRNLPNDSAIELTDDYLRPSDIKIKFKDIRPIIFINACHGGRVGFSFTRIGGWAEKFVNARVGVFIGAMWEVNDELAYQFAEKFYTALLKDNLTVAEAFQKSRQAIRDVAPYNSTWLAYSLYADPEARIQPWA